MVQNWVSAQEEVHRSLGFHLMEAGLLTEAQTKVIALDQASSGLSVGEIAVFRGWVKEQTVKYLMQRVILPAQTDREIIEDLQRERDTLKRERDTLRIERDTLRIERDTLHSETEILRNEKNTVELERSLSKSTYPPKHTYPPKQTHPPTTMKASIPPSAEDDDDVRWVG
jgi:FtsZ-binding cell division protein ZapB